MAAVVVAVLAGVVTAVQLSRPGLLLGITPDVSAWLGASVRLVHGAVPYRDFFLSQPPGFTLLAAPFAFVSEAVGTRDALAVLRAFAPLVSVANVLLIARLLRPRGPAAVVVGAAVAALSPAMLYAMQGPMLEPFLALFCLLGLTLIFDGDGNVGGRRLALGGAAMGLAIAIKLSALVPVLALALVLALAARRRLAPFAAGVAAGCGVPSIPFIVLAPTQFLRDVVGTQLNRVPAAARLPVGPRLSDITGTAWFGGGDIAAVAILLVGACAVIAAYVIAPRRLALLDLFAIVATLAVLTAQLIPALYYPHYAALAVPFIALLLGLTTGRLVTLGMRAAVSALALAMCAALVALDVVAMRNLSAPDVAAVVDSVVPAGGCALSDAPSKLVTSNRFVAARAGCTTVTDPNGEAVALLGDPALAAESWQSAFEHADYVVTDHPISAWYISPTPSLLRYVAQQFRTEWRGGLLFYVRKSVPSRM